MQLKTFLRILPPERSKVSMPRFRPAQGLKAPLGVRTAFLGGAQPENPSTQVKLAKLGVLLTHRQGLQLWGAALGDGIGVSGTILADFRWA